MFEEEQLNILIIDDHPKQIIDFEKIFAEENFKIFFADGLKNGIEISKRYLPNLIICFLLSDKSNILFIKSLQSDPETSIIPTLCISSDKSLNSFRTIMNAGADDFFFQNFLEKDLIESIKVRVNKIRNLKNNLMEICEKTFDVKNKQQKDHILITVGRKLQLIKFSNIACITSENEYSKIRTINCKSILIRKSLKNWLKILPAKDFLRIHRKNIININAITKIEKSNESSSYLVYLTSITKPLKLSRRYSYIMKKEFGL